MHADIGQGRIRILHGGDNLSVFSRLALLKGSLILAVHPQQLRATQGKKRLIDAAVFAQNVQPGTDLVRINSGRKAVNGPDGLVYGVREVLAKGGNQFYQGLVPGILHSCLKPAHIVGCKVGSCPGPVNRLFQCNHDRLGEGTFFAGRTQLLLQFINARSSDTEIV